MPRDFLFFQPCWFTNDETWLVRLQCFVDTAALTVTVILPAYHFTSCN